MLLDALAQANVLRHAARKGKFAEFQRVGTIGRGLARGNQLVGGGHGVVDDGGQFEEHIFLHRVHLGPVLDVRTVLQRLVEVFVAETVIDATLVDLRIEVVGHVAVGVIDVGSGSDDTTVGSRSGNRTGIHQRHERELTLTGLRTFAVGEVTGGVANRQAVVGGHVAGTEARATEGRLDNHASLEQFLGDAAARRGHINGRRLRIGRHREVVVTDGLVFHDGSSSREVVVGTARAACDDTLVGIDLAVAHLVNELDIDFRAEFLLSVLLDFLQNLDGIGLQFVNRHGVRRVERQCNHRLLLREVDLDHCVVVSDLAGLQFLVALGALVDFVVMLHFVIGHPNRAQTGRLSRHNVNTVTEVDGQVLHARTSEFEHLVLHETALERSLHERNGHVVRADTLLRSTFEPNEYHFGSVDVPSVLQQLFYEFTTAFADAHVTERTVARVAVRTQNHIAALHHCFTHILVDNGLVSRHIDAAVLLRSRKTEHVVVFVDSSANSTERVVAVGHGIRQGEFLETTGAGGLNDAHVGDVVRCHCVETNAHLLTLRAVHVVCAENAVGDGFFTCFVGSGQASSVVHDFLSVEEINSMFDKFYHNC